MYYEAIQRQGYTNKGMLIGDWIGREDKGGQAWLTYHLSGNEWVQVSARNQKVAKDFIPGGTTLNDINFQVVKRIGEGFRDQRQVWIRALEGADLPDRRAGVSREPEYGDEHDDPVDVVSAAEGKFLRSAQTAERSARAGMGAVIDLGQLRGGELGVALGCGKALVAQQFLYGAQVGALFKQMRTEGVAQRVRMHVRGQAAKNGDALDDAAHAAGGEPRLAAGFIEAAQLQIDEERRGDRALGRLRLQQAAQSARQDRRGEPLRAASPRGT